MNIGTTSFSEGRRDSHRSRVFLTIAVAAATALSGAVVGYFVGHTATSGPPHATIDGKIYDVQNVSWIQPQFPAWCPNGTTASSILLLVPWGGAVFEVTLLPEACGFPSGGAFAYLANVSVPTTSPASGSFFHVWSGSIGFENRDLSWSNLTLLLDGGEYGLWCFPDHSVATPSSGHGMIAYTFWLLVRA
jgi:hypothetical protein